MDTIFTIIILTVLVFFIGTLFNNIPEGEIGIVTRFGRFMRTIPSGFNALFPWDSVLKLSIQNKAIEMEFQAITLDQASVYFNCTILFSVVGTDDEMVKCAVYSFASKYEFDLSVQRLLEDETRAYVATKRQAEMIGISQDVVVKIKQNVDAKIAQWGYQVEDLRYNNLHFDNNPSAPNNIMQ